MYVRKGKRWTDSKSSSNRSRGLFRVDNEKAGAISKMIEYLSCTINAYTFLIPGSLFLAAAISSSTTTRIPTSSSTDNTKVFVPSSSCGLRKCVNMLRNLSKLVDTHIRRVDTFVLPLQSQQKIIKSKIQSI